MSTRKNLRAATICLLCSFSIIAFPVHAQDTSPAAQAAAVAADASLTEAQKAAEIVAIVSSLPTTASTQTSSIFAAAVAGAVSPEALAIAAVQSGAETPIISVMMEAVVSTAGVADGGAVVGAAIDAIPASLGVDANGVPLENVIADAAMEGAVLAAMSAPGQTQQQRDAIAQSMVSAAIAADAGLGVAVVRAASRAAPQLAVDFGTTPIDGASVGDVAAAAVEGAEEAPQIGNVTPSNIAGQMSAAIATLPGISQNDVDQALSDIATASDDPADSVASLTNDAETAAVTGTDAIDGADNAGDEGLGGDVTATPVVAASSASEAVQNSGSPN